MVIHKSIVYILLTEVIVFCLCVFPPNTRNLVEEDYAISHMDIALEKVLRLDLPKSDISNFYISFNPGKSSGRVAVINMSFNSNMGFEELSEAIFNKHDGYKLSKRNGDISRVYIDNRLEYRIQYIKDIHKYNIMVTLL